MKTTRITEMFAFVAIDPADNTEGVIASKLYDGGWMPLVGADMDRIESLRTRSQHRPRDWPAGSLAAVHLPRGTAAVTALPNWAMCHIHNASERQTVDSFKACGECWHVWQTAEDFWIDVEAMCIEMRWPPWPRDQPVYACPLCTHDF